MRVCSGCLRRMYVPRLAALVFGVLALFVPCVHATIPDVVFTLSAGNDSGHGSYLVPSEKGEWDPNSETFTWSLPEPVDIYDDMNSMWVATLLNADVVLCTGELCRIDLNICVLSGRSETTFVIASPLISFPIIPAEYAEARAAATVNGTEFEGEYAEIGISSCRVSVSRLV